MRATATLPQSANLHSSDSLLTGADIAFLSGSYAVGFVDHADTYSVVLQMLDGLWARTGLRELPLSLLRPKLCLALFGGAPDRRTEKKWQRQVDQLIADAINGAEVQLVRGDGRQ